MIRALLLFLVASAALADDGLSISLGKSMIGSEACFDSLLVGQELADRRWLATLSTHGAGFCRNQEARANMGVGIVRTTHLGKFSLGFGAGLWEHGDRAVGPRDDVDRVQLCAHIHLRRYLFADRVVLDLQHCSTGGSTYHNPGRNLLALGVRF